VPKASSSAIDKALDLVETISRSDRPLRLSELAAEVQMHRATVYRVLQDLIRRGWVMRTDDYYLPGSAVLQLSRTASRNSLSALCHPVMLALSDRTDMMVNLQVLEFDRSRVIDVVCPLRLQMITDLRDELLPVHRFAGPIALIATLGESDRAPYLKAAEQAGYPLTGETGLIADLDRAARTGFALERSRNEKFIASVSRAVVTPKENPICALTIVGLEAEFDGPGMDKLQAELKAATDELQERLNTLGAGNP
jgi:IclR family transcriptional regulator, acetate operon repressor